MLLQEGKWTRSSVQRKRISGSLEVCLRLVARQKNNCKNGALKTVIIFNNEYLENQGVSAAGRTLPLNNSSISSSSRRLGKRGYTWDSSVLEGNVSENCSRKKEGGEGEMTRDGFADQKSRPRIPGYFMMPEKGYGLLKREIARAGESRVAEGIKGKKEALDSCYARAETSKEWQSIMAKYNVRHLQIPWRGGRGVIETCGRNEGRI